MKPARPLRSPTPSRICTAGDVLIAFACYAIASLATRSRCWPHQRPLQGLAVYLLAALAYTAFSEWLNVSVRGSWTYTPTMPTIGGIGLSPLLQWLVPPPAILFLHRRSIAAT